jgi:tRNA-specific adenosine deaminase 1
VAIGTGSKCVGHTVASIGGDQLIDSHAEVIARRSFVRYLLHHVDLFASSIPPPPPPPPTEVLPQRATATDPELNCTRRRLAACGCIFKAPDNLLPDTETDAINATAGAGPACLALRDGVTFHMYTSQAPCGDASIYVIDDPIEMCLPAACSKAAEGGAPAEVASRAAAAAVSTNTGVDANAATSIGVSSIASGMSSSTSPPPKRRRTSPDGGCERCVAPESGDLHRTGAKPVGTGPQDPLAPGLGYHTVGGLRTKPGRGCPSQSM